MDIDDDQDDLVLRLLVLAALFLCSIVAAGAPLLSASKQPDNATSRGAFFAFGRHFGTGVILATALVHLLQDAFRTLSESAMWRKWTGAVVLSALLGTFVVEYVTTLYVERLSVPSPAPTPDEDMEPPYRDDPTCEADANSLPNGAHRSHATSARRRLVAVLILQAGLTAHSLVIGITLAVVSPVRFPPLAVAIGVHQLFEGLALGVRLAPLRRGYARALAFLFAIAVPAGAGLGLAWRPTGILPGVFQALASGMLLYAGTVEMLARDFAGPIRRPGLALSFVVLGAIAMSVLGIWA